MDKRVLLEMKAKCITHDLLDLEVDNIRFYADATPTMIADTFEEYFGTTQYRLDIIDSLGVWFQRTIDNKKILLSTDCLKCCVYRTGKNYAYTELESFIKKDTDGDLKLGIVNDLLHNWNYNTQDAYEVADFIIKQEEKQNAEDGNYDYAQFGARWCDDELIEYVVDGGDAYDIDTILSWDNFTRLESGLIVSWRY